MSLLKRCQSLVDQHGTLIVFPIKDKPSVPSLWSGLYPKTKMRWEWDEGGDSKVFSLWQAREELSRSGKAVYGKWYRGRATFFSPERFRDLLTVVRSVQQEQQLHGEAALIYETLCESSPLSTKELKAITELRGKSFESLFQKAVKKLFERGLIVAWGEVDEGAFPSLAYGATKLMFEDLWLGHEDEDIAKAKARLDRAMAPDFKKFLDQILSKML